MTKQVLINQLKNTKNTYVLSLAAISLFSEENSHKHLDISSCKFGSFEIKFSVVSNLLRNINDREIAIKEFLKTHLRVLLKESFEIIKDYCENTNQRNKMTSNDWYQFSRMIRNCISHNFYFEFNDYDKTKLPQIWKNRTIDLALDGKPMKLDFLGYDGVWELFKEFNDFAQTID